MSFCPYCGKEVSEGATGCTACYAKLEARKKVDSDWKQGLFLGMIGTLIMIGAGAAMASIRSAGERTVMEAYYNSMGWGFIGLGIVGMTILFFMFGSRPRP